MTAVKTWQFGPHTMQFEEPDVLSLKMVGEMGLEHMRELMPAMKAFMAEHPNTYCLTDLGGGSGWSPDARKHMAETSKGMQQPLLTVLVGGSFAVRTVMNMVLRAMSMLNSSMSATHFVATDAEARALLAKDRAARATAKAS